jgi:hypothetical protein
MGGTIGLVLAGLLSTLPLLTVAVGLGWFLRVRVIRVDWGQLFPWWLGMNAVGYWVVLGMMLLG